MKFYKCDQCGKVVAIIDGQCMQTDCCMEHMHPLVEHEEDVTSEKHVPCLSFEEDGLHVKIGLLPHPANDKHYISWVYVECYDGGQLKYLGCKSQPEAVFHVKKENVKRVYCYCNIHGLYKKEL